MQQYRKNKMTKAIINGQSLPISTKHSVEICNFIRSKNLQKAKTQLELVLKKKLAIPLKYFHKDRGHKKGIGPGFYPQNASKEIINLLNGLEANARVKGMDVNTLFLETIIANKASRPRKPGRFFGRHAKRTNIKMIAIEKKSKEGKDDRKKVRKPKN